MGTVNVSARWAGEALNYIGTDSKGNEIEMGGDNVSPSQMVLLGLAGCMGMDVLSILQKKRASITGIGVEIKGHQPDSYPKPFQTIELVFKVKGDKIDPKAVARAIELSHEKYCIVGQSLQQNVEIKATFEVKA